MAYLKTGFLRADKHWNEARPLLAKLEAIEAEEAELRKEVSEKKQKEKGPKENLKERSRR